MKLTEFDQQNLNKKFKKKTIKIQYNFKQKIKKMENLLLFANEEITNAK